MAVLLIVGVMDLRAMIVVTAAVTFERLALDKRAARIVGAVAIVAGGILIAHAAALAISP
jgi:predicted metal-binding membrane protein